MGQSTTPKALALGCFRSPSRAACCRARPLRTKPQKHDESANAADSARGTAGGADSALRARPPSPMATIKPTSTPTTPSRQSHGRWPSRWHANTQLRSLSNEMKYFARIREQPEL